VDVTTPNAPLHVTALLYLSEIVLTVVNLVGAICLQMHITKVIQAIRAYGVHATLPFQKVVYGECCNSAIGFFAANSHPVSGSVK
jgi:hypothetical protein